MAKKAPKPILRYTELLCLAYRALEIEVNQWMEACSGMPNPTEQVAHICERQIAQMEAIRTIYHIETGSEL
jgi:hypothetical protein